MDIKIKILDNTAKPPTKGSNLAAGYDLYTTETYELKPMERRLFKTGISMSIPYGMYGRIAPRSGLSLKDGIDVMAGVIDPDYSGEIGVLLINLGSEIKKITPEKAIAQLIFEKYYSINFAKVDKLPETIRGANGFGSTDNKSLEGMYNKSGGVVTGEKYTEKIKKEENS